MAPGLGQPGPTACRSSLGGSMARQSFQALKMKNATAYASTPPISKDALKNFLQISNRRSAKHHSSKSQMNQMANQQQAPRPVNFLQQQPPPGTRILGYSND